MVFNVHHLALSLAASKDLGPPPSLCIRLTSVYLQLPSQRSKGGGNPAKMFLLNTWQWQAIVTSHGISGSYEAGTHASQKNQCYPHSKIPASMWLGKWTAGHLERSATSLPQSHPPGLAPTFELEAVAFIVTQHWGVACLWSFQEVALWSPWWKGSQSLTVGHGGLAGHNLGISWINSIRTASKPHPWSMTWARQQTMFEKTSLLTVRAYENKKA